MKNRNTIQGALILEKVKNLKGHACAEEIYEAVTHEHPNISKATVYRNLNRLSEQGQIHKIEVPGSPDNFEFRTVLHYHVNCERCGRIFDVDMPYNHHLEDHIADKHGFIFTGHDIIFKGFCPDCQKDLHKKHNY